jgi:hypothetical protein
MRGNCDEVGGLPKNSEGQYGGRSWTRKLALRMLLRPPKIEVWGLFYRIRESQDLRGQDFRVQEK